MFVESPPNIGPFTKSLSFKVYPDPGKSSVTAYALFVYVISKDEPKPVPPFTTGVNALNVPSPSYAVPSTSTVNTPPSENVSVTTNIKSFAGVVPPNWEPDILNLSPIL